MKTVINIGTIVTFKTNDQDKKIGRFIGVASKKLDIPPSERLQFDDHTIYPLLLINIFTKKEDLPRSTTYPTILHDISFQGIPELVVTNGIMWIKIQNIIQITFVFSFNKIRSPQFDCYGMNNCFVVQYFFNYSTNLVSLIDSNTFYSFPYEVPNFLRFFSLCYVQDIWNGIDAIKVEFRKILCRTALSQGNSCKKTCKINVSRGVWSYINDFARQNGLQVHCSSHTKKDFRLLKGMRSHSRRQIISTELISFDTIAKIEVLTSIFGPFSWIGVRKTSPPLKSTYTCQNPNPTLYGDTLNVVDVSENTPNLKSSRDRVDLSFDGFQLKILLCYSKHVLNDVKTISNPLLKVVLEDELLPPPKDIITETRFTIKKDQQFEDDRGNVFVVERVNEDKSSISALLIWPTPVNNQVQQVFPINNDLIERIKKAQ